ncbi:MAG: hypothetical protein HXY20_09955 [Acidobacteria bacterium]|nr:hypothetical protein [Acidobacteriota bacterium]
MTANDVQSRDREDLERRIRELKEKLQRLAGGTARFGLSKACPLDIQEKFLEHVLRYEQTTPVPLFEVLTRNGVRMPPPETMDDFQLRAKLWEVIHRMAMLGAYLENTDHLSDRELYRRLWAEILHDPLVLMPEDPNYTNHCDLIGAFSQENIHTWLKYYADENERQAWVEEWPDLAIPEHEPAPFDRDRHLPRPHSDGRLRA